MSENLKKHLEVYVFSSCRPRHIQLAIEHGIWKIHCAKLQVARLMGKATGKIYEDSFGIFYDAIWGFNSFTVPFVFTSEVGYTFSDEPFERIDGEKYWLEFNLCPLGPTSKFVTKGMFPRFSRLTDPTHIVDCNMAVNPTQIFQPCLIEKEEWDRLLEKLI